MVMKLRTCRPTERGSERKSTQTTTAAVFCSPATGGRNSRARTLHTRKTTKTSGGSVASSRLLDVLGSAGITCCESRPPSASLRNRLTGNGQAQRHPKESRVGVSCKKRGGSSRSQNVGNTKFEKTILYSKLDLKKKTKINTSPRLFANAH